MTDAKRQFTKVAAMAVVFPVYNDEATVERIVEKARAVLSTIAHKRQIVIIDDGSPDKAGEIADQLSAKYEEVKVVHHPRCMGYGAALLAGINLSLEFDWICLTDGDDQYDLRELYHISTLLHRYDMIICFRYCKIYSTWRMLLSAVYNLLLRFVFRSHFRDISCGLKLLRREVVTNTNIQSTSPFFGAEITLQAMLKGYHIGEVGINTYPRHLGCSTATSWGNIIATITDMIRFRRCVFRNFSRENINLR